MTAILCQPQCVNYGKFIEYIEYNFFISFSLMDNVDPNFECISNSIKKD